MFSLNSTEIAAAKTAGKKKIKFLAAKSGNFKVFFFLLM